MTLIFDDNNPERVFGLQVRCRELEIFKKFIFLLFSGILEVIFWIFLGILEEVFLVFFWRKFFGGLLGRISWEEFFVYIVKVI